MYQWLRRVTPDLFLAALVALGITIALHTLDKIEDQRIVTEVRWEAHDGLTIDERLGAFDSSIRRSVLVHMPFLVLAASVVVGLACRRRRWAWLTATLAVIPTLLMGASFFIDVPLAGSGVIASYLLLTVTVSSGTVAVRNQVVPAPPAADS
jgi:hypothetical protein